MDNDRAVRWILEDGRRTHCFQKISEDTAALKRLPTPQRGNSIAASIPLLRCVVLGSSDPAKQDRCFPPAALRERSMKPHAFSRDSIAYRGIHAVARVTSAVPLCKLRAQIIERRSDRSVTLFSRPRGWFFRQLDSVFGRQQARCIALGHLAGHPAGRVHFPRSIAGCAEYH